MKKINKKIVISIFVFLIVILLSISIIIANNAVNKTNFEVDKQKIYYEIKYFDSQVIYMINLLNNIEGDTNFYINWKQLQNQTQILYSYWNSVILDLNYLSIDKNTLTDFGKNLDTLTVSIKNMDKEAVLDNLLEIYKKLVIYSESLEYGNYNEILNCKYNLLLAYSIAEKENWTLTHEYILEASNNISNLVNLLEINDYNINQAYIAIKELENVINIKDINVFYIKYLIAINRLENLTID